MNLIFNTHLPKISLLVSTYNWPEALELVLLSLKRQSHLPDEVLIADDGSTKETKILIDKYKKEIQVPIIHIWQEDKGFRKSLILNKALAISKSDYIIQIDGDCIMHKDFVADHIRFAKKGFYLYGSRVNIQKYHLENLFKSKQINFNFFSSGIKKRSRTIHLPFLNNFYKPINKVSSKLRGCNMSYFREDVFAINGYNNDFEGWGLEDSDLAIRLHNYGIKGKRLKFCAIVYHIFHQEREKKTSEIKKMMKKLAQDNQFYWVKNGIVSE